MGVTLVQPRELHREYAIHVQEQHDQDMARRKHEDEARVAKDKRRVFLESTMAKAADLGLNVDRHKGGAHGGEWQRSYGVVEMSPATYRELVDEIARLREQVDQGGGDATA